MKKLVAISAAAIAVVAVAAGCSTAAPDASETKWRDTNPIPPISHVKVDDDAMTRAGMEIFWGEQDRYDQETTCDLHSDSPAWLADQVQSQIHEDGFYPQKPVIRAFFNEVCK